VTGVGQGDIERALREVGVRPGALLIVHSSLSSFGRVIGGPEAVIEALMAVVGDGTIVMPTYTDRSLSKDPERDFREYDAATERCITGAICERFRLRRDVIRQPHDPWHPMAIWGRDQKALIEAPAGSAYHFFMERGGETLLIGVGHEVHSFVHWMLDEAPRFGAPDTGIGVHSILFPRLEPWIERPGAQRSVSCGASRFRLVDLHRARKAIHQALRECPDLFAAPPCPEERRLRINVTVPRDPRAEKDQ
jgi:hypothetical protein